MRQYTVECRGDVREVYVVEAVSMADAMRRWHEGDLVISEAQGVEPVSARLDYDDEDDD
jgi:hypothetical protein